MLGFVLDHPWSPIVNAGLVYNFGVDRIYSFGDIAISRFWRFALKLPIHVVVSAVHAQNQQYIYFRGGNHPHIWIHGVNLPTQYPTSKGVAF